MSTYFYANTERLSEILYSLLIFTSIYRDTNVLYDKALGDVKRSSYFISRYNIIVHKYVVTYSVVRCSLLNSHLNKCSVYYQSTQLRVSREN